MKQSSGKHLVTAGGAVVTREHPTHGREVVIVYRKRYDDWTLPKGKAIAGESLPVAAVREVEEETGVTVRLGTPLDTISYSISKGTKRVDYWVGEPLDIADAFAGDDVDEIAWLPVRLAAERLSFAHDHFLVQQALEQPVTVPLVLVRHGKAMDRKDWSKRDAARPIATLGRKQAKELVPMLTAYGVERVVSSTSCRCVSTVKPYADSVGAAVEQIGRLSEEDGAGHPKLVAKAVTAIRDATVARRQPTAICVHRPVLPHILAALDLAPASLKTAEMLVAHLTTDGRVHAVERHRPLA